MKTITKSLLAFATLLGLCAGGIVTAQQGAPQHVAPANAAELVKAANEAHSKKEYVQAAKLFEEAVAKGAHDLDDYYNAACAYALAGNKDKAFAWLDKTMQAGWRNSDHLKRDSDLTSLRDDPRWPRIVAASDAQLAKYRKEHSDPNKARFITTDIPRFWQAYDKVLAAAPAEREAILQREYIEPGTIGLQDFSRSGRLNAQVLLKKLEARPAFFNALRPLANNIGAHRAETVGAFRKLKKLYPDAIFPEVYFVIGQLSSGGTASSNGLLMGAEMFSRAAATPTRELNEWEQSAIMEGSEIPPLVAHEAIHFQQQYPAQFSLLCQCLKEGSADFLGELTSGRLIKRMQTTHAWANAREAQLWAEFQQDLPKNAMQRWLYGSAGADGRPVDLGYWLGYKISAAYYQQAADKKQAVRDMLVVKDCQSFLKTSGYADKFPAGAPAK